MKIITNQMIEKQPTNTWVALDTEIFRMEEHKMHRPTNGKFAALTVCINPEEVYIYTDSVYVPHVLSQLEDCIWVLHHAKFDLTHLRRWTVIEPRKKLWDTLLIDRILWGGYFNEFGLEDCARRYLDIELDKSIAKKFADTDELTEELVQYSCTDTSVTLQVCQAQRKLVKKSHMKIWKEIDLPALWAFMDMKGYRVNATAWTALAERNKGRQLEVDNKLSFNPRSHTQVVENLRKKGFKQLPNSQEDTLRRWMKRYPNTEAYNLCKLVLESRDWGTRASRNGMNFLKNHLEGEYIFANYSIIGAETGRTACSDPNLTNVPVRKTKEFRECFIASPDNKLVVSDFGQQELRILAYISQDKKLIELLRNRDKDIFVQMVKVIWNKDVIKKDPLRLSVKSLVYGMNYGISPEAFAEEAGISLQEAVETMDKFFRSFPDAGMYLDTVAKNKHHVDTVAGRRVYLNPYSGQCERNAKNAPIQGTAADMFKKSLGRIYQEWTADQSIIGYPFGVVAAVHDEIVADVPEYFAEDCGKMITSIMSAVGEEMCPGIPFPAEYAIGDNWSCKA